MGRTARDLVDLADKIVEHGFKCGTTLSKARLKQLKAVNASLLSRAADQQYGRGAFGAPHGAANESKYGYMFLISTENNGICVDDYYDWSVKWINSDTLELTSGDSKYEMGYDYLSDIFSDKPFICELMLKLKPATITSTTTLST